VDLPFWCFIKELTSSFEVADESEELRLEDGQGSLRVFAISVSNKTITVIATGKNVHERHG
jgi:hypothetical protein